VKLSAKEAGMRQLVLEGTPYAMGVAHGRALRAEIHTLAEERLRLSLAAAAEIGRPATRGAALALARDFLPIQERWSPAVHAEFMGIAEGAGIAPELLLIGNGYTDFKDVLCRQPVLAGAAQECTVFRAGLPATRDGRSYVGQTWDMHSTAEPFILCVLRRPADAPATLGITTLGVIAALAAVRPWSRLLSPGDAGARWLQRFAGTAYFWLAVAALLLLGLRCAKAVRPVSPLLGHAFGGASRHALTVGFVSLMIVGVAWRILPIFSGASRAHPALIPSVFALLVTGNTLRVTGQAAAGHWGGAWYGLMGISGWLELTGVTLFALDVLRLLRATPEQAELPSAGAVVAPALEAPVGPLVAHRPWLIPVFARHGMGQVSNAIFQRTVGQRVTVLQACRRFQIEPEAFLAELIAANAEREREGPRPDDRARKLPVHG
jgi:hypothetical protein